MRVSTLYVEKGGVLHRLHPLTKMVFLGCLLLVAFAYDGGALALGALAVLMLLAALGGVLGRLLRSLAGTVLPLMASLFLLDGLLYHESGHVLLQVGLLSVKEEGLQIAGAICTRLLLAVTAALLLLLTTHPGRLVRALTDKGVPHWIGHILLAAFQMVPEAAARVGVIADAQRARGLRLHGGSLFSRLRALPPLLAPLLLGTLAEVEEQAMALEARGFNRRGPRTSLAVSAELAWEPLLRWAVLLAACFVVARLRGWL